MVLKAENTKEIKLTLDWKSDLFSDKEKKLKGIIGFTKFPDQFMTCDFRLTVEKVPSHPLAKRHRADIEGCINPDNSAIVISILVAEFKFPHEVDVHRIVSTEFLGS